MRPLKRHLSLFIALLLLLACRGFAAAEQAVLTLPSAVTRIEEEAFFGDTSIRQVSLPEGVEWIGPRAFAGSSLTRISLPGSLTYIAEDAFEGSGLKSVDAPEDSYAWRWARDHGYYLERNAFALPASVSLSDDGQVTMALVEPQAHTLMLGVYRESAGQPRAFSLFATAYAEGYDLLAVLPVRVAENSAEASANIGNFISETGSYYVAVKAVESADEEGARDMSLGSTLSSNTVYFTRPDVSLDQPEGLAWSSVYGRAVWNAVEGAASYQVMLYSWDDIVASRNINTTHFDFSDGWIDFNRTEENRYTFTVTALSADIARVSNSPESARSFVLDPPASLDPVAIVTQPASRYAGLGQTVQVSIAASGLGLTYDWYVNGELAVSGMDDATVGVKAAETGEIAVYAVVRDALGYSVESETAVITVVDDSPVASVITEQPADRTVDPNGADLVFTTYAQLSPGFQADYKWYISRDGAEWEYYCSGSKAYVAAFTRNDGVMLRCAVTATAPTGKVVCEETSETATLHINKKAVAIERNLKNDYYTKSTAFISIEASGENLTYQWYANRVALEEANTDTLPLSIIVREADVYCVVSNGEVSEQSNTAHIHLGGNPATEVRVHKANGPDSDHLAVGDVVTLSAALTPSDSDSRVSWTSSDTAVATVTSGQSTRVSIHALGTAVITATTEEGLSASFTVTADSCLIEFNPDGGRFSDGASVNRIVRARYGESVALPSVSKDGDTFLGWTLDGENVVTDLIAVERTGLIAKWELSTQQEDKELAIDQDLAADQYAQIGRNALFEVVTNGAKVRSYQWQVNDGSGWQDYGSDVKNDGSKTSLEVEATAENDGYQFRVVITAFRNNAEVVSNTCTLTTGETETPPQAEDRIVFTTQPVSCTVAEGTEALFIAAVRNENAAYQWQCNGQDIPGATDQLLEFDSASLDMSGNQYTCVVTVDGASKASATAILTVIQRPKVELSEDLSIDYYPGSGKGFEVVAKGVDLHYKWYVKQAGGQTFEPVEGNDDSVYAPALTPADDGLQVYCVVTDLGVEPYAESVSTVATFHWTVCTVTYVAAGGQWEDGSVTHVVDGVFPGLYEIEVDDPFWEEYAFAGWSTDPESSETVTSIKIYEDTTLFAVWREKLAAPTGLVWNGTRAIWADAFGIAGRRYEYSVTLYADGAERVTVDGLTDGFYDFASEIKLDPDATYTFAVVVRAFTDEPYTKEEAASEESDPLQGLPAPEIRGWDGTQAAFHPLDGAEGYVIELFRSEEDELVSDQIVKTDGLSWDFSERITVDVDPSVEWRFRVAAYGQPKDGSDQGVIIRGSFSPISEAWVMPVPKEHTVFCNSDGGTFEEGFSIREFIFISGTTVSLDTLEIPTKESCEFLGWTLNGEPVEGTIVVDRDMELIASWKEIPLLKIVKQPESLTLAEGAEAAFTVEVRLVSSEQETEAVGANYLWQRMDDAGQWQDIGERAEPIYEFIAQTADSGRQFRVVVTCDYQIVESEPAALTVEPALAVETDFDDMTTVTAGEIFTLTASSSTHPDARLTWYQADLEDNAFPIGEGNVLSLTAEPGMNGYSYYCLAETENQSRESNRTRLVVEEPRASVTSVTIWAEQTNLTLDMMAMGMTTEPLMIYSTVEASGATEDLTYSWELSYDEDSWEDANEENMSEEAGSYTANLYVSGQFYYRLTVNGVTSNTVKIWVENMNECCGCGMPDCTCGAECPIMGGGGPGEWDPDMP